VFYGSRAATMRASGKRPRHSRDAGAVRAAGLEALERRFPQIGLADITTGFSNHIAAR